MTDHTYNVIKPTNDAPIKAWTKGVPLEDLVDVVHTLRQVVCVKGRRKMQISTPA
jgi:hypothetical protein